ncbi:MAG: hypothetical protein ACI9JM_002742 [Halioglobus sp.]|jgi:hypothetical protein
MIKLLRLYTLALPLTLWAWLPSQAQDTGAFEEALNSISDSPHTRVIEMQESAVKDHEIGLSSIKKVRGVWSFKKSERVDGELVSRTWQILDGFDSSAVMEDLLTNFKVTEQAELLFGCDGRSCGQSAQWANRIFGQRVLYGREDLQQYRVYALQRDAEYRLVVYSASRTTERQYLHADLVQLDDLVQANLASPEVD